jgi:ssRNA-specific RNase YbeY (16S rRNA maturation enzyme)
VGLRGTEQSQLEAWIGRLLFGYFDPLNLSFLQTDIRPQTPETKELKQKQWKQMSVTDVLSAPPNGEL